MPPDFSSKEYWSTRFTTETSFEWLLPSERIIPFVAETIEHIIKARRRQSQQIESGVIRILHLGAGTSTLGLDIYDHFRNNPLGDEQGQVDVRVVDCDYVLPPTRTLSTCTSTTAKTAIQEVGSSSTNTVPFIILNLLSPSSLLSSAPGEGEGWDILLDKSTSDAISCGPPLPPLLMENGEGEEAPIEPIERMLYSLSKVTKRHSRWISISYSSTRYDFPTEMFGWIVSMKRFIVIPKLDDNANKIVYEPETGVWVYILERQ